MGREVGYEQMALTEGFVRSDETLHGKEGQTFRKDRWHCLSERATVKSTLGRSAHRAFPQQESLQLDIFPS